MGRRTIFLLATTALAVLLSSSVALALNTIYCEDFARCVGTDRADLMKGTDGFNEMYGRGEGDTLKGFGRSDALLGQEGNDRLLGGLGRDFVLGGKGDDRLRGDDGGDAYFFERSKWGQDTIIEVSPSRNFLILPFMENFTGTIITNLTSSTAAEVSNAAGASTVNWEGSVIFLVVGSSGNDTVTGNDAANDIYDDAGPFTDTGPDTDDITGAGGNDLIVVEDGDSGDTVSCGEGRDTVFFDEGDTLVVPTDCEKQNPEDPRLPEATASENAPGGDLSELRSFQSGR